MMMDGTNFSQFQAISHRCVVFFFVFEGITTDLSMSVYVQDKNRLANVRKYVNYLHYS